ncbi:hypothetical protein FACS1894193_08330 [Bacilli bacterium]|nr:hypothetical protein FACS1894193_08330 [Bacilli bacterium]GHU45744.1 hypothetical protein FACS1894194_2160 [Bacilli bacterium]
MANFGERFLFFSTSPRNPFLIKKYIEIIGENKLEGRIYDSSLQADFYQFLSKAKVAGQEAGGAKDPTFAGRDKLTRSPQALGFLITQNNKPFEVTRAGKLLENDALFEDVLLHQLLKFQLPSKLHQEKESNRGFFCIKPFLELLRLVDTLGYLTYQELQIFGMTLTDYRKFEDVVGKIGKFREDREIVRGTISLSKFAEDKQIEVFSELYADIISSKKFKTRESKTETEEKFTKKKLRNLSDYTDSIFRALRATGLIVFTKGRSISISKERQNEVDYILKHIKRDIEPIDMSRAVFDDYISNPELPKLLNDNIEIISKEISQQGIEVSDDSDIYELKSILNEIRKQKRQLIFNRQIVELKKKSSEDIADIIEMYQDISNKEVPKSMRSTLFEWNTWRAMTMINHGHIVGNFIVDDSGMPISTASGGQGDIVGYYGDFNIVIEVTLSTGSRQYEMEGEPVTRHVGELQKMSDNTTFGLFIADKLNDTVINHFYVTTNTVSKVYNGKVVVIPISTSQFIDFFKKASQIELEAEKLLTINSFSKERAKLALMKEETEEEWHKDVLEYIMSIAD